VTTVQLDPAGDAVVTDLPHDLYLAHPALSASGAKTLVRPGGPARYKHDRDHGQAPRRAFDVGHAVHAAVLGVDPGTDVVLCTPKTGDPYPAEDYKSASAREHRDAIRAAGRIPVLASDLTLAENMAAALRAHPIAARLLHPDTGRAELSLFWHDPEHGVDRRGRVDWLRHPDPSGRLILVDYKTCASADPAALRAAVVRFGYHQQAAWYRDLVVGLGLAASAPFVFVFQEKEPPYLPHVVELDEGLLRMGAERNALALSIFRDCTERGVWPGYSDASITLLTAPTWALYEHDELLGGVEP
jgi:PDDEXK-like domain of unknown function (DUF3799)